MILLSKSTALVWIKGILALSSTDSTITAFFCKWNGKYSWKKTQHKLLIFIVPVAAHFFGRICFNFFPLFLDMIMCVNEFQWQGKN